MRRRQVDGPFKAVDLGAGSWLLTAPLKGVEILLRGAGPAAFETLMDEGLEALTIEWRSEGVEVAADARGRVLLMTAASATIHEPVPHVYEALPLARFDADAQRFWRRVFLLMRLPGGRLLLKVFARRKRA